MSSPEPPSPGTPAPSLRRRLALQLSGALGLLLLLLFVALDQLIDHELYARLDAGLLDRARAIAAFLEARPDPGALAALRGLMPEYELPGHTDFFEVWDADGAPRLRSGASAGRELAHPPEPDDGRIVYYDTELPDRHAGRAVAMTVTARLDGRFAPVTLAVATERAPIDSLAHNVHYTLLAGIALATMLATAIALFAVRRGLAPLQRFGAEVAGADVDARALADLAHAGLPRELQPFAHSLLSAFDRLHTTIERERRFSRDVAHELRTPLAEIRASTEAAMRSRGDRAATAAAFATSIAAVERMQRAIDTLLLLARHEAGHAPPALDPLDFATLLNGLLDSLEPAAAARGIRFERHGMAPAWIRSDTGSLERIASNLLRNAIEYSPAGAGIDVTLAAAGDAVELRIANPVSNLAAEDLANFGRRFWRKSPSGSTSDHAGLGLALARTLAHGLGLQLEFALEAGRLVARLGPLRAL